MNDQNVVSEDVKTASVRAEERERIAKRIEETARRHEASEQGVTLGESCLYEVCAMIAREGGLRP